MCDLHHHHHAGPYGFLVDVPQVRALIDETHRIIAAMRTDRERVEALRPAFLRLLLADGWLPGDCAAPDEGSRMGGGIGQYALYRAEDGSLCLFSLVVPVGAETPVHDHLAWDRRRYRGTQDETVYRRLDDGTDQGGRRWRSRSAERCTAVLRAVPPAGDIHFVRPSVCRRSRYLLANDTRASGGIVSIRRGDRQAVPFRCVNAPCPPEEEVGN